MTEIFFNLNIQLTPVVEGTSEYSYLFCILKSNNLVSALVKNLAKIMKTSEDERILNYLKGGRH